MFGEELRQRQVPRLQGRPVVGPFVPDPPGHQFVGVRPGEQDADLLEQFPDGRGDQLPCGQFVAAQPFGPHRRFGSSPRQVLTIAGVDPTAGEHRRSRQELHPGHPPQDEHLQSGVGVAEQHDRSGRPGWGNLERVGFLQPAAERIRVELRNLEFASDHRARVAAPGPSSQQGQQSGGPVTEIQVPSGRCRG